MKDKLRRVVVKPMEIFHLKSRNSLLLVKINTPIYLTEENINLISKLNYTIKDDPLKITQEDIDIIIENQKIKND